MNKFLLALPLLLSACLQPVGEGLPEAASPEAGSPRDAGSSLPDAGPVLFGLAKRDCGPTDGPAWQLLLSELPVTCETASSEGFYVNLWTGSLDVRTFSLPANGSACLCGVVGDTSTSGTVTIDSASDAGVSGRIDATFHSGAVRHDAFQLIVCPGAPLCG